MDSLAAEIVQRIVYVLRLFNQQTHRLVLSGQAVQKKIMQRITAANLALCSQCCGLVAQILPKLQATLTGVLQDQPAGKALAGDLANIATLYGDHRKELFTKLSALLSERYVHHAKRWLSTPHGELQEDNPLWTEDPTTVDPEAEVNLTPHEALEGFVKDITKMYTTLLRHLSNDVVRGIFAKAFEDIATRFEQRLGQDFQTPSPPYMDQVGRTLGDRLALDIAYMGEQLEKLAVINKPLQQLLAGFLQNLQTRLPVDEELKLLNHTVVEALQRRGKLPQG